MYVRVLGYMRVCACVSLYANGAKCSFGLSSLLPSGCPILLPLPLPIPMPQTIIECLKYATTGEIPPMSKGGAFIHDPKLASETEIKAKVKLQFRDRAGNKTVVSRIMQATQKVMRCTCLITAFLCIIAQLLW